MQVNTIRSAAGGASESLEMNVSLRLGAGCHITCLRLAVDFFRMMQVPSWASTLKARTRFHHHFLHSSPRGTHTYVGIYRTFSAGANGRRTVSAIGVQMGERSGVPTDHGPYHLIIYYTLIMNQDKQHILEEIMSALPAARYGGVLPPRIVDPSSLIPALTRLDGRKHWERVVKSGMSTMTRADPRFYHGLARRVRMSSSYQDSSDDASM